MQCSVCHSENSAQALFCEKCGARIARKPPPIDVEVAEEAEVHVKRRPSAPGDSDSSRDFDRPRRRRVVVEDDDRPSGGAIVPYRNPLALFGYYCVFFGIIVGIGAITAVAFFVNANGLNKAEDISFSRTVIAIGFIVGMILELAAFLLGIFGLLYVRNHPTARGTGHAMIGVILGPVLMIVELAALIFMINWINNQFQH